MEVECVLLKRIYVVFFIELDTRRVCVTGVTAHTIGHGCSAARDLTMMLDGRARRRPTGLSPSSEEDLSIEPFCLSHCAVSVIG